MNEAEVQARIQIDAMKLNCNLMRNNTGVLYNDRGTPVRYGLGNVSKKHNDSIKSSDLIGFTVVEITHDMVGKRVAVFTAAEIKDTGWNKIESRYDAHERAQFNFIKWIISNGGIGCFANSVDKLAEAIRSWRYGRVR